MTKRIGQMFAAAIVFGLAVPAFGQNVEEILGKARMKYDALSDAELKFVQSVKFPASRVEQRAEGTLQMKKGNHYRLETGEMTLVTDGVTVWSHSRSTNQVLVDNFSPDERVFSPERILGAGPADFAATFLGNEKVNGVPCAVVRMLPSGEQNFVRSMKLWISESDHLARKVELTDANGKETTYIVSEIRVNTGIPDSRFTYKAPEGAEVVDLR